MMSWKEFVSKLPSLFSVEYNVTDGKIIGIDGAHVGLVYLEDEVESTDVVSFVDEHYSKRLSYKEKAKIPDLKLMEEGSMLPLNTDTLKKLIKDGVRAITKETKKKGTKIWLYFYVPDEEDSVIVGVQAGELITSEFKEVYPYTATKYTLEKPHSLILARYPVDIFEQLLEFMPDGETIRLEFNHEYPLRATCGKTGFMIAPARFIDNEDEKLISTIMGTGIMEKKETILDSAVEEW